MKIERNAVIEGYRPKKKLGDIVKEELAAFIESDDENVVFTFENENQALYYRDIARMFLKNYLYNRQRSRNKTERRSVLMEAAEKEALNYKVHRHGLKLIIERNK